MSAAPHARLPLRVLVKGASTVNWISPMSGPRTDFIFPRVVEEQLLSAGHAVQVQVRSLASEPAGSLLGRWEEEVLGYSPDVIVLVYGHYETIHLFLPRWFERHANSLRSRRGPLARLYRDRLLRPIWMGLARLQARADRVVDPTLRRGRPRRVARDIELYVRHVRTVGRPLVYVFELLPPAARRESWFPGMARRVEVMNRTIAATVDALDDEVRYFRVSPLVQEIADGDLDVATPDGFHYSPALHRRVGEVLAQDVARWADDQPHLTTRTTAR